MVCIETYWLFVDAARSVVRVLSAHLLGRERLRNLRHLGEIKRWLDGRERFGKNMDELEALLNAVEGNYVRDCLEESCTEREDGDSSSQLRVLVWLNLGLGSASTPCQENSRYSINEVC